VEDLDFDDYSNLENGPIVFADADIAPAPLIPPACWLSTGGGVLSNNGATLEKKSVKNWTCNSRGSVGWSEGSHVWSVCLENSPKVSVGISREDIHFTECPPNDEKRIDVYCVTGDIIGIFEYEVFGENYLPGPLKAGDAVNFRLDMDAKTLHIGLNGVWRDEPALTSKYIIGGKWYPYVAVQGRGCRVTIAIE
jgi:hypothetical protein